MNKRVKTKDGKSFLTTFLEFWPTLPGILTGIAAIITAIGGLYIAGVNGSKTVAPTGSATPASQPTAPTSRPLHSPGQSPTAPRDSEDCSTRYFSEIPKDRVASMEVGTVDFPILRPDQPKDRVIGVRFTEYNRPIGAVKLHFFSTNTIFKVATLADAKCQEIEEYSNASRGGDKHVLQNWDTLQMRLGGHEYALYLGYDAGTITAKFQRVSP